MLSVWNPPSAFESLQLLDAKYASPMVRKYAVSRLHNLGERECADFLLQQPDLLAQRRLADMQALGSAGEMQLLGDGDEVTQVAQLHVSYRLKR